MSGTLLFCVWQSNRADGDYVRFSTDGAWHDPGLHCGMIRNDHALVVSPASVSLAGLVAPVLYTYEFRVENAPIRPSEMSALTVEARWPNGRQSYPLNGYGRVVLAQDARFARDIYLVSDRYTLDGAVSVSNAFVNGMLMEQRIVVPLATITPAAAPQPTATGPVRQQAIGCFASNECHSDMTAMTAAAAFPGVEPATLEPLGRRDWELVLVGHGRRGVVEILRGLCFGCAGFDPAGHAAAAAGDADAPDPALGALAPPRVG